MKQIRFNWGALKKLPSFKVALFAIRVMTFPYKKLSRQYSEQVSKAIHTQPRECVMSNSDIFLKNKVGATDQEMLVYLTLLSRRDCLNYTLYNVTGLKHCFAFDFDIEKLRRNRLLYISDTNIFFKYEEKQ